MKKKVRREGRSNVAWLTKPEEPWSIWDIRSVLARTTHVGLHTSHPIGTLEFVREWGNQVWTMAMTTLVLILA